MNSSMNYLIRYLLTPIKCILDEAKNTVFIIYLNIIFSSIKYILNALFLII